MTEQSAAFTSDAIQKPRNFNARLKFSPFLPYRDLFAERIPLIQCLHMAIANYIHTNRRRHLLGRVATALSLRQPFTFAECGVFTGNSLVATAQLVENMGLKFQAYGLDTFEGLPPLSETDKQFAPEDASYRSKPTFEDTSVSIVRDKLDQAGVGKQTTLLQGLFNDTLPLLPEQKYHFVNIDCDLYEPHLECLEYFYSRMVPGGILFFDDYHSVQYPMAAKAVDDFLADKPERLSHLRFGDDAPNHTKSYIVKY